MLQFIVALLLIVGIMLVYRAVVRLVVDADSPLWRARRHRRDTLVVRREAADLDREYASLVDEYRDLTP